ncbi:fibronectin type III domain-containing protein [Chryseoglobus sp. 28M-23]|uniref:fibronectin type III domain-containing protein n=1 Tax=Chryseoglobus sp. 28M-23 TaxID=2772253 RepID=UPI0017464052|nr:fibronectin type III domain-containing protein [Chryseoglobus sp. 28M-23]QOD93714.1 fibronectin type III domain-containing protein [Chryseoglobus sp. 28M-23]
MRTTTSTHGGRRRRQHLGLLTSTGLIAALVAFPATGASAAPSVSNSGSPASYTEQEPPVPVAENVTITGGTAYAGEYLDFTVDSGTSYESLSLMTTGSASTANGVISIVGTAVYLGNGSTADPVGSVDPVRNGQNGQPLRVNFTSEFTNPSFETSTLTGWTTMNQRIDLGVTSIAGRVPTDTSTYPGNTPNQDNNVPDTLGSYNAYIQSSQASQGGYALRLESSGIWTRQGCDVVHGPAVYSDPFESGAGDSIYFDWRAFAGDDDYHVFGYIVDQNGTQIEVLDATGGGNTAWTTKETVIPNSGTYRFVFVSGTYDATCGQAAGASLYIDNVRVFGTKVNDTVVQDIARKLQYENQSDNPPTSRTITIAAKSNSTGIGTGQVSVDITPVDDAPTFVDPAPSTFTNAEGPETRTPLTGTLLATDPEDDPRTYSLTGGTAEVVTIGEQEYTEYVTGEYGTLRLDSASGAYLFEAHDDAIDARLIDDEEVFAASVDALGLTDAGQITLRVSVPDTAPGSPTLLAASPRPESAALSWTAPEWLGGSEISGYRIEGAANGGAWQTLVADTGSASTEHTVSGLTNGVPMSFRVSAINATGTGAPSSTAEATPVDVPGAASDVAASPDDRSLTVTWSTPADTGGLPILGYRVQISTDGEEWTTAVDDTESTATTFAIGELENGTPYTVRVIALNAEGAGPASTVATATPRTVPDAPLDLAAAPDDEAVDLSWTAPLEDGGNPVSGYRIESTTDGETWSVVVADTGSTDTTLRVAGLTNGESLTFRVSALNEAGDGAPSGTATATPRTVPDAPGIDGVDPGNRSLILTVAAPAFDGGAPITGYEFSIDDGVMWTSATMDDTGLRVQAWGLTNDVEHSILIRAVNEAGPGAASDPATGTPEVRPVYDGGGLVPEIPTTPPGTGTLLVDGVPQEVVITVDGDTTTMTGEGFTMTLTAYDADGGSFPVDAQGRLIVTEDGSVRVSGSGFLPVSTVDVWLFSTPHLLGELLVDSGGRFSATLPLPGGIAVGEHTIQLNGVAAGGEVRSLTTGIVVVATPAAALASTGAAASESAALGMVALLLLGTMLVAVGRRRTAVRA